MRNQHQLIRLAIQTAPVFGLLLLAGPQLSAQNPFEPGAADPFSAGAAADPFGAPAAEAAPAGNPFEPSFGAADPAAPAAAPAAAAPAPAIPDAASDPFGGAPAAPPPAPAGDPFGAAAAGSPFGDPPAAAPPAAAGDPFGEAAAPAAAPGDVFNPFMAAPTESANPFGAPADSAAPADPAAASGSDSNRKISTVSQFRFRERERPDGTRAVERVRMSIGEAELFDNAIKGFYKKLAEDGELNALQVGVNDPTEWSEWMAYSYQVKLWQQYCESMVLAGSGFSESGTDTEFRWPGDAASAANPNAPGGAAGGQDGVPAPTDPNSVWNKSSQSLDDQLGDFFTVSDTRAQSAPPVIDPKQMDARTTAIYKIYWEALRDFEKQQHDFVVSLGKDLKNREARRESYRLWRESQMDAVKEFVQEWEKRYEGQVTVVAGVRYELYRPENVPTETVRGANVVITDYDLTPYDLLNNDGTLRGASKQ